MTLFQSGDFTLASGRRATWKIECDALTADDWAGLAAIAAEFLPPFGEVLGVPRGGLPFAAALEKYVTPAGDRNILVAEDVVTTGGSIERFRDAIHTGGLNVIGVCVFARGPCPAWVTPLFRMPTV